MQHANLIEEQIESCRKLLQIFRDERESFGESETIDLNLIMKMLKRKQDILQSFEMQKKLMSDIRESGYQDEESEKLLLKELGKILEQLLVIDQENEVLMRDMLTKKPGKAAVSQNNGMPSLRPGLPFCPGKKPLSSVNPAVNTLPDAQVNSTAQNNLFSRNRLKAYGA